jgi:O-acetyl-ADP-ribose deacetylase (regulator of RNase III)
MTRPSRTDRTEVEASKIELHPERSEQADVILADLESLEDFEAELDDLSAASEWSVSLWLEPPTTLSLADAAYGLGRAVRAHRPRRVRVWVRPGRPADRVRSILRQSQRAPVRFQRGAVAIEIHPRGVTELDGDVVVNASNTSLRLGAGVSGALARAAGPALQSAMSAQAPIPLDGFAETPSFDHGRVQSILHVPTANGDAKVVGTAYRNVLRVSLARGYRRVVLPSLGTGTGGLSAEAGAQLLASEIAALPADSSLELRIAALDADIFDAFSNALG